MYKNKHKNRNEITELDGRYVRQQNAIREICRDLDLVAYYPSYHADAKDNNTVIIYTKDGHKYNENNLTKWSSVDDEKGRVCSFQNTDINGRFDLNYINNGSIALKFGDEKEQLEDAIKKCLSREI